MKLIGQFTVFMLLILAGFVMGLLNTYIILDIAKLYDLQFITQFKFIQIYGVILIIQYIRIKIDNTKADLETAFINIVTLCLMSLVTWGLAYIAYNIIS